MSCPYRAKDAANQRVPQDALPQAFLNSGASATLAPHMPAACKRATSGGGVANATAATGLLSLRAKRWQQWWRMWRCALWDVGCYCGGGDRLRGSRDHHRWSQSPPPLLLRRRPCSPQPPPSATQRHTAMVAPSGPAKMSIGLDHRERGPHPRRRRRRPRLARPLGRPPGWRRRWAWGSRLRRRLVWESGLQGAPALAAESNPHDLSLRVWL